MSNESEGDFTGNLNYRRRCSNPSAEASATELKERVGAYLDTLDARDRQIGRLKFLEEQSNKRIADDLEIPPPTVRRVILRIQTGLQEVLKSYRD